MSINMEQEEADSLQIKFFILNSIYFLQYRKHVCLTLWVDCGELDLFSFFLVVLGDRNEEGING